MVGLHNPFLPLSFESIILPLLKGKSFFTKVFTKDKKDRIEERAEENVEKMYPACYSFERLKCVKPGEFSPEMTDMEI